MKIHTQSHTIFTDGMEALFWQNVVGEESLSFIVFKDCSLKRLFMGQA